MMVFHIGELFYTIIYLTFAGSNSKPLAVVTLDEDGNEVHEQPLNLSQEKVETAQLPLVPVAEMHQAPPGANTEEHAPANVEAKMEAANGSNDTSNDQSAEQNVEDKGVSAINMENVGRIEIGDASNDISNEQNMEEVEGPDNNMDMETEASLLESDPENDSESVEANIEAGKIAGEDTVKATSNEEGKELNE